MNREIKFRVWDNVDYMTSPFDLHDLMFSEIEFTTDCPIMQYTGLKDKRGKEIYEGDIIRGIHPFAYSDLKATKSHVVIFKNGCFELNGSPLGWDTDELDEETGKIRPYNTTNWAYVHGNIYQNPELLETVQK